MDENDKPAAAEKPAKKTSTPAPAEEPTQSPAETAASAEPAAATPAAYAAVSGAAVDPIAYSRAVPTQETGPRRSLTVYHMQRALAEKGFHDAWADLIYGDLTRLSIRQWQASRDEDETGILTRDQFVALFEGDPNVELTLDTIGDHPVE